MVIVAGSTLGCGLGRSGEEVLPTDAAASSALSSDAGGPTYGDDANVELGNSDATFVAPPESDGASSGSNCDYHGTWGTMLTIPVSWMPQGLTGFILASGSGIIQQWIKGERVQQGSSLTDTTVVCGITLPPFQETATVGGETYGVVFPAALFNEPTGFMPTFLVHGAVTGFDAGSIYTTSSSAVLIGLTLSGPATDPWPSTITTSVDTDHDGKPGVTVNAAQGPPYSNIPVGLPALFQQPQRADRLYIALRQVTAVTGTVTDCDHISGTVTIPQISQKPAIDSHVIGCALVDGGGDCNSSQASFVDNTQPVFTPSGKATFKSLRLPGDATCATVKAMLQ
jgi:hypothetical protein